ncbi:MAG: flavodoxin family protein [Promethearchaeota archaeon]
MKVLVIYDSVYGNTEQIAQAIGNALGSQEDVKILQVSNVKPEQLTGLKLLIVGSPTHGGRPTPAIRDFLNNVTESAIREINVAAFDTRVTTRLARIFGYAAGRIAGRLKRKGGALIASPEGFFVKGGKGPLKEGELERAASWAKEFTKGEK